MKKFNYIIIAIIFITLGCNSRKMIKANYAYDNMSYFEAANYYEQILIEKKDARLYSKIAYCNLKMNKPYVAAKWYKKAIESKAYNDKDVLNYAISLKNSGNPEESRIWFSKYLQNNSNDKIAVVMKESLDSFDLYYSDSSQWTIRKLNLPGSESNFSPAYYDNGLVYCSAGINSPVSNWDGRPYLDLYQVKQNE